MTHTRAPLLMCPDCGGLLESSRPGWVNAIELAAAGVEIPDGVPVRWHCPLCGYQEEPGARAPADGPRARG